MQNLKLNLVVCINQKNAIGKGNDLLYHIYNDFQNFKRLTTDNIVVMGDRTLESLPGSKPLPNRINVVLSLDPDYKAEDVIVLNNIDDISQLSIFNNKEIFIIGGATIYKLFVERDMIDTMYITEVKDDTEGDAYFPKIDTDKYKLVFQTPFYTDEKTSLEYRYNIWKKRAA